MKVTIVGKGGVGKTTIAACLARLIGRNGYRVIAVDADPSLNLASSLGILKRESEKFPTLFSEEEFIKSRTMLPEGLYIMNPKVDDIVEKFGIKGPDNVILIKFGEIKSGGTRCLCPEYAFLRTLFSHLILGRGEIVIFDMVAGLEHMSRGATRGVDLMVCITEPSIKSIEVAVQMQKLAKDIHIKDFVIVANKVRDLKDVELIERYFRKNIILSVIPYDENIIEADKLGISLIDYAPNSDAVKAINELKELILSIYLLKKK
ncbi:MAG: AAA family ATPase [Candidatus Methanomethylicia archaeon]|nr:AAA family ATPase [Candidatus Methanomethylicia archaeon]MCX8168913.1 AAA family ATPase [Candidatus Methanomethylicia archaeon]MDW7988645.1 AAA family ATPase [Nitrososphaerota archaeon]